MCSDVNIFWLKPLSLVGEWIVALNRRVLENIYEVRFLHENFRWEFRKRCLRSWGPFFGKYKVRSFTRNPGACRDE